MSGHLRWRTAARSPVIVVLLWATVALGGGCVANPVGPVSTFRSYQEKAARTVGDANSAIETVRLAARGELRGSTFTTFSIQLADDSLETLRTAQDTFETITPPDAESIALRIEVLDALDESRRSIADVVVALEQGDPALLRGALTDVDAAADTLGELEALVEGRS